MSEKVWPVDKLGNEIREGKLLLLKMDEPSAIFYVMSVSPASVLHGGDGPYPVSGEVELVLKFKIPYQPDHRQLFKAIVVETPEPEQGTQGVH